jgi:hypothetical protein
MAGHSAREALTERRDFVGDTIDDRALDLLFRQARTQNGWLPTPVTDDQLRALYDILRVGPTSANTCPRASSSCARRRPRPGCCPR